MRNILEPSTVTTSSLIGLLNKPITPPVSSIRTLYAGQPPHPAGATDRVDLYSPNANRIAHHNYGEPLRLLVTERIIPAGERRFRQVAKAALEIRYHRAPWLMNQKLPDGCLDVKMYLSPNADLRDDEGLQFISGLTLYTSNLQKRTYDQDLLFSPFYPVRFDEVPLTEDQNAEKVTAWHASLAVNHQDPISSDEPNPSTGKLGSPPHAIELLISAGGMAAGISIIRNDNIIGRPSRDHLFVTMSGPSREARETAFK